MVSPLSLSVHLSLCLSVCLSAYCTEYRASHSQYELLNCFSILLNFRSFRLLCCHVLFIFVIRRSFLLVISGPFYEHRNFVDILSRSLLSFSSVVCACFCHFLHACIVL